MRFPIKQALSQSTALLLFICMAQAGMAAVIEPHRQMEYADRLFEQGQYRRAAEEYQRFTFFFPDSPNLRQAIFRSGRAFLHADDPGLALNQFKQLTDTFDLDALAIEAYFMSVECDLQLKLTTRAIARLHNLITLIDGDDVKDRAYHRLGWIHIDLTDWSGARQAIDRISDSGRRRFRVAELEAALAQSTSLSRKSPALAGTLSVIPGAGQLYCHRYEDALIALLVNAGLIWSAYDAYDKEQYGLGSLLTFVGLGFYAGNIYGAVTDAHKYNQFRKQEFIDRLKRDHLIGSHRTPQASAGGVFVGLHFSF
jgi:tetratricopeptide (TPR) repeat protein